MSHITRRSILQGAAAAGVAGGTLLDMARAFAQESPWKPEAGATLNVLRWKRFVQAEDDAFMKMVDAYQKAFNVKVNISNESFDDMQPKASVAANTGTGPDLVWGLHSTPQLFPEKCLPVQDVADYLGKKYGGWFPAAEAYGKSGGKWIAIPVAVNGGYINYRISSINKAGFKEIPKDTAGFLELCKALKKNGTPSGFALGHASGDANAWIHWLLWSHNAWLVDKDDKIVFFPIDLLDDLTNGLVLGGVPADVQVVVAGQDLVTEGDVVHPVAADPELIKKLIGEVAGTN